MSSPAQDLPATCPGCSRIDRRAFLAQSTLIAVGAFLAACSSGTGPDNGLPMTVKLGDFPALASVGGMARVDGGMGTPVAVVRATDTGYHAFSLICPHQGFLVNINGSAFLCSGHGARFAADGRWTGGQPTSNLTALPTSYDATAGTLTIG